MGTYGDETFWGRIWRWIVTPFEYLERAYFRVMIMLRYIPLAWNDQDWDWAWILRMMQHKIRRTRICIQNHGHHEDSTEICQEMKDVEDHIQRILDDDYVMDNLMEYHKKYPPHFKSIINSPNSEMIHPKASPEDEASYQQASQMRQLLEVNDWMALWIKIERNMKKWWD